MNYEEFFQRFGRSLETKNIRKRNRFGRLKRRGRDFVLPPSSEAPERFIGLCPWEAEYLFMIARRARVRHLPEPGALRRPLAARAPLPAGDGRN